MEKQLERIRSAIASLEFGGRGVPSPERMKRGRGRPGRKRRKVSAKVRRAMSRAQKRRWAKQKVSA